MWPLQVVRQSRILAPSRDASGAGAGNLRAAQFQKSFFSHSKHEVMSIVEDN
jgi:hypothetical protein